MSDIWYVGAWRVDFRQAAVRRRWAVLSTTKTFDRRLADVLRTLIEHRGEVVSVETLLERAWRDRVVSRDSVTTAIYQLRQLLEDSTHDREYIRSEARRGYRLVAQTRRASSVRRRYAAAAAAASFAAIVAYASARFVTVEKAPTVFVEPLINYAESPVQGALFTAVENTLLSELIQRVPGGILATDNDARLKLQSMVVACDLGPTLVTRLLDTRSETFVWSKTYNLEEAAENNEGPTLVVQAATDIGRAIAAKSMDESKVDGLKL